MLSVILEKFLEKIKTLIPSVLEEFKYVVKEKRV